MSTTPAAAADRPAIDALLDAAFGPARHARTAALLRIGAQPIAGPSLIARAADGTLLASIEYWPLALVAGSTTVPLTLLGPLAVAPAARDQGHGRRLIAASLTIADAMALDPILLIGDPSYYGPFGFTADATAGWHLPGPVERHRLLLRQRVARLMPASGHVVAADSVRNAELATTAVDA